jgi:cell division protein FtsL
MSPAKLAYLVVLGAALALAVVWQSARMREVGYRTQELRTELNQCHAELAARRAHLSKLKNPRRIVALVDWLGLELHEPEPAALARADGGALPAERTVAVAELASSRP